MSNILDSAMEKAKAELSGRSIRYDGGAGQTPFPEPRRYTLYDPPVPTMIPDTPPQVDVPFLPPRRQISKYTLPRFMFERKSMLPWFHTAYPTGLTIRNPLCTLERFPVLPPAVAWVELQRGDKILVQNRLHYVHSTSLKSVTTVDMLTLEHHTLACDEDTVFTQPEIHYERALIRQQEQLNDSNFVLLTIDMVDSNHLQQVPLCTTNANSYPALINALQMVRWDAGETLEVWIASSACEVGVSWILGWKNGNSCVIEIPISSEAGGWGTFCSAGISPAIVAEEDLGAVRLRRGRKCTHCGTRDGKLKTNQIQK